MDKNEQRIITYRNVYTGALHKLCELHEYVLDDAGDCQIQHGLHGGPCDVCANAQEGARKNYLAHFASLAEAFEHEHTVLGIGREFLPACALAVLEGGPATAEYWHWLITQIEVIR